MLLVALVILPRGAARYSVLAHEANVDALWHARIRPLLLAKYPRVPNVTKVAWEKKQEPIQKNTPGLLRERFVLSLPRAAYEKEFGPKIGPLRPLAFKVPTPEAEKLFLDSLERTRERFGAALRELPEGGCNCRT